MSDLTVTPIRSDLFRFVTIRTPQLIDSKKKKLWYITHPDEKKSLLLKNTLTGTLDESRESLKGAIKKI